MKIFVFGDSVVQGRSDAECFGWVNRLAVFTQQEAIRTDWEQADLVFNLGCAGDETTDVLARFASEFKARRGQRSDIIILGVGINDAAHRDEVSNTLVPMPQSRENIAQLLKEAKQLVDQVCILGLTRVDEAKFVSYCSNLLDKSWVNANVATYDTMISDVADQEGVIYVPMHNVVPVGYCDDGLHPNAKGHQLIFERVKQALVEEGVL